MVLISAAIGQFADRRLVDHAARETQHVGHRVLFAGIRIHAAATEGRPSVVSWIAISARDWRNALFAHIERSCAPGTLRAVGGSMSSTSGSSRASWTGLGGASRSANSTPVVRRTPLLVGASAKPPSASRTGWPSPALPLTP